MDRLCAASLSIRREVVLNCQKSKKLHSSRLTYNRLSTNSSLTTQGKCTQATSGKLELGEQRSTV